MIFVVLFSAVGLAAWVVKHTIVDSSRRAPRWCTAYCWIAQTILLCLGPSDWAYSVVDASLFQLMALGHWETLLIFLPALILVFLIALRPRTRTGLILMILVFQAATFIPALLILEHKTGISFLSWTTCVALTLSCSSAIFALGPLLAYGAEQGGRFHEIAYKDRSDLVSYLSEAAATYGDFKLSPAITFLDTGTVAGKIQDRDVRLKSWFSFRPFGYGLDFRMKLQHEQPAWLLGHKNPDSTPPEARSWRRISNEEEPGEIYAPTSNELTQSQISRLSELTTGLYELDGFLICADNFLYFRQTSRWKLGFNASSAQDLLNIAAQLDSPPSPEPSAIHEDNDEDPHV